MNFHFFLAALILLFLPSCITIKSFLTTPEVEFDRIETKEFTLENIQAEIFLKVKNENYISIPLESVDYEVYLFDELIYADSQSEIFGLPSQSEKVIGFPLRIDSKGIRLLIEQLLKKSEVTYSIKGEAKISYFTLDFEETSTISVPGIELKDIQLKGINNGELDFNVLLSVENKNKFEIPIQSFAYKILLGENQIFDVKLNNSQVIPPETKKDFELPFKAQVDKLFSLLKKEDSEIRFLTLEATVGLGFEQFDFNKKIPIDFQKYASNPLLRLLIKKLEDLSN